MSKFHLLEVVGRGSETQLQVGENLNKLTWRMKIKLYSYILFSFENVICNSTLRIL